MFYNTILCWPTSPSDNPNNGQELYSNMIINPVNNKKHFVQKDMYMYNQVDVYTPGGFSRISYYMGD